MIKIIGLGPGSSDALTLSTVEVLKNSHKIYLRTEKHPTVKYLCDIGIRFETYDGAYEKFDDFDGVYSFIAEDLIKKALEYKDIVYAVPGHPLVAEKSVNILMKLCDKKDIKYEIYPAVSFIDVIMEKLKIDPIGGMKIVDAFDIKNQIFDKRTGIIITQVHDRLIASEVKLSLFQYYDDNTPIYFIRAAGVKDMESIRKIPLYELDRQQDIDYLTSVFIPKNVGNKKDFYDLLKIMNKLRGENGCPWDREQTHETLKKDLIEESYEVLEAIDKKNPDMLVEELGDVLLQIVFHAQIGKEDDFFDINDVINGICVKMIERHPHVFGSVNVNNSEEVINNWDKIKKKEQKLKTHTDELRHVAKNLPALMRAQKVQRKASKVGFDWDRVEEAMNKVLEEFNEVKDVYKSNNKAKITEELGDLIFAVVNITRFLDIDPESALNFSIEKFINRFEYIEKAGCKNHNLMENMSLDEMNKLWEEAKNTKFC